jgi:GNAT superfamily N-acetyltransferase
MEPVRLEPFDPLDPEVLLGLAALQNRLAAPRRRFGLEALRGQLTDAARGAGSHVAVAWRGATPVGFAGWVSLGAATGEFYSAPCWAVDPQAATLLIERVAAEARAAGAAWVRMGSWPEETAKREALIGAGFAPAIDLVDLEVDTATAAAAPAAASVIPDSLRRVPPRLDAIDLAAFVELNNDSFRRTANSPPISLEVARDNWAEPALWPPGSLILADGDGVYQAFTLCHLADGGATVLVESVGVRSTGQRRGLGRAVLAEVVRAAAAAGIHRLRSVVASDNPGSLALHAAFGHAPVDRRTVWQLPLHG